MRLSKGHISIFTTQTCFLKNTKRTGSRANGAGLDERKKLGLVRDRLKIKRRQAIKALKCTENLRILIHSGIKLFASLNKDNKKKGKYTAKHLHNAPEHVAGCVDLRPRRIAGVSCSVLRQRSSEEQDVWLWEGEEDPLLSPPFTHDGTVSLRH